MSNKLQNIKAIRQMLDGNHRMQTRKSVSMHYDKSKVEFESKKRSMQPGDALVEEIMSPNNTVVYRTHFCTGLNTFMQVSGKWNSYEEYQASRQEIMDTLNPFKECYPDYEDCTKSTPSRVDERMARKTGRCLACQTRYETQLQIRGEFNTYAMDKMRANVKAWMRDQEIELEKWKETMRSDISYLNNGDGDIEDWSTDGGVETVIEKFEAEFMQMKRQMFENYGIEIDEE